MFVVPAFACLFVQDSILRRAIRRQYDNARCPGCRQSLQGLPFETKDGEDAVRCTEYGR
ncbi:MAG: hypothetical protein AAF235_10975 [Planctomycetota bacterium]